MSTYYGYYLNNWKSNMMPVGYNCTELKYCESLGNYTVTNIGTDTTSAIVDQTFVNIFENLSKTDLKKVINLPDFPHSDVYIDSTHAIVMEFALAGYCKDSISVEGSKSNDLSIKATAKESKKPYLKQGISKKEVDITIRLADVYQVDKAQAEFTDGLLIIKIPRSVENKMKKIL